MRLLLWDMLVELAGRLRIVEGGNGGNRGLDGSRKEILVGYAIWL